MSGNSHRAAHFEPEANEKLVLFGEEYVIQPHPSASQLPFSSEGRRAVVCQLRNSVSDRFALKVFKKRFRNASVLQSADSLQWLEKVDGMRAARRRILLPDGPEVQQNSDLAYAVLMPWLAGHTWFDILQKTQNGFYLRQSSAIHLCYRFLSVAAGLEQGGIAHTDLSPANVMVDFSRTDASVQFLDLEEIYIPNTTGPAELMKGTVGYCHQSADDGKTLWRPDGDRYAASILAAEMLILANHNLAQLASEDGFFLGNSRSKAGRERYEIAQNWLYLIAPRFAKLFKHSWESRDLSNSPRISSLCEAVGEIAQKTPLESGPPLVERATVVVWEAIDPLRLKPPRLTRKAKRHAPATVDTVPAIEPMLGRTIRPSLMLFLAIGAILALVIGLSVAYYLTR